MIELAPSLLSADFSNLSKDIKILNDNGINYLHLDIMDGNFVPNISYGPGVIKAIRGLTDMIFDVHLMVDKPERYIKDYVDAGADIITVHYEATKHPHRTIQQIKSYGVKAGISLNPSTPLNVLDYIIEDLDLVLIMSVNPGFGGQSYIKTMDEKISKLKDIKSNKKLNFIIEVDGGIKTTNVKNVIELGAELIVSGSDVFGANDITQRIIEYKDIFNNHD